MFVHVNESTSDPSLAPTHYGQHWINTSTNKHWLAKGTSSVGDWVEFLPGGGGVSGSGVAGRVPIWSSTSALTSSPALTFDVTKSALATGDSSQSLGLDTFAANDSSIAGALTDSFVPTITGGVSLSQYQIVYAGDQTSVIPEGSIIKFTNNGSLTYTVASSSVFDSVNTTVTVYDPFNAYYYGIINPVTSLLSTPASKANSVAMIGGLAYGQNSLAIGALSESLGERSIAIGERNKVNQLTYNIGTTQNPIAISPTTFTFSGDLTGDLAVGYYVRITYSGEFQRLKIVSSVFSGNTVVTFDQTINHSNQSFFYFTVARIQGYYLNNSGVAIGQINNITGDSSIGIGKNNRIDKANSYAFGEQLTSSYNNTYLFGKGLNADQADALFIGSSASAVLKIAVSTSSFSGPLTASVFNGPTIGLHTGALDLNSNSISRAANIFDTLSALSLNVTNRQAFDGFGNLLIDWSNPSSTGTNFPLDASVGSDIAGGTVYFGGTGGSGSINATPSLMRINGSAGIELNPGGSVGVAVTGADGAIYGGSFASPSWTITTNSFGVFGTVGVAQQTGDIGDALLAYGLVASPVVNPSVIATNDAATTVTFNASKNDETIYDDSATLVASQTINLPTVTRVGQICRYVTARVATATTVTGTISVGAALTTLAANASVAWQAVDTSGTFIRIQ